MGVPLGREILRSARHFGVEIAFFRRTAKVDEFYLKCGGVNKNVFVFEVAVADAGPVKVTGTLGQLVENDLGGFLRDCAKLAGEVEEVHGVLELFHDEDEGRAAFEPVQGPGHLLRNLGRFEVKSDFGRAEAVV